MEVARLLGDRKAIILFGHGATSTGSSLEEAVMNILSLEEQAKMNWYAYCAAGPNHPSIPDELIDEKFNRPGLRTLPHFKDVWPEDGQRMTGGVYNYYSDMVSRDL